MYYIFAVHVVSMIAILVLMPAWIHASTFFSYFQPIREDGPDMHKELKKNTPSMGGVVLFLVWLWMSMSMTYQPRQVHYGLWVCTTGFFLLGLYDDVLKISLRNTYALGVRNKFILQCIIACVSLVSVTVWVEDISFLQQYIPYVGYIQLPVWFGSILWVSTIVGASNAVNLVDGLDGLASSVCLAVCAGLWFCAGGVQHLDYMMAPLMGVLLGFLWYNFKPADVMMGDSGSLFLGAFMAYCALVTHNVAVFIIMSGVLIVTTLSVVIQVGYYKMTQGKRFFKMAPLHHHFELMGMPETRIVIRYFLTTCMCVMVACLCRF